MNQAPFCLAAPNGCSLHYLHHFLKIVSRLATDPLLFEYVFGPCY